MKSLISITKKVKNYNAPPKIIAALKNMKLNTEQKPKLSFRFW